MTKAERELLILIVKFVMDVMSWDNPQIRNSPAWAELVEKLSAVEGPKPSAVDEMKALDGFTVKS